MRLHVPGSPSIVVEPLGPPTEEVANEMVRFYAESWDDTYNRKLGADMDVALLADPAGNGNPEHVRRELRRIQNQDGRYTQVVARHLSEQARPIVGQVLLIDGTEEHPDALVLEEWNTAPGYQRQRIGAAVLAAAIRNQRVGRQLALIVLETNPLVELYANKWRLQVTGSHAYTNIIRSGVPHLTMEGADTGLRQWLAKRQRLTQIDE